MRDAGITWSIVRGDDVVKVQRRAGHKLIATTMRYVVEAENRGATFGDPFSPLPGSLIDPGRAPGTDGTPSDRPNQPGDRPKPATTTAKLSKSNASFVHGKGVEPLRLAAAEPKADRESHANPDILQIRGIDDPRSDEIERVDVPVGQSSGNPDGRVGALQAAIDRLTRAIATADDQTIPDLVTERRAMRDELGALLNQANAP